MKKKLVIFDLDGTLTNTIADITTAINLALTDLNLRNVSIDEAKYLTGSGVDILAERTLKLVLEDKYEEEKNTYLSLFKSYYQDYYTLHQKDTTAPYPGISEGLKKLKRNGVKIAVLSNKPHFDVLKIIDYYFNDINFDYVLGKKPENGIKPSIDGIIEIENAINIKNKEDILYVGDTNIDMQTARNAGLKMCACLWGFRKMEELKEADRLAYIAEDFVDEALNG